ncbi:transcription-repair coupling factor [Porticoccus litoralis]|uniref:Transcription-repair-coupling factor n=1 Tax=Porticoccus litoralis TaxID=434086 RepID=A0AAW8B6K5_9GAMM|nr:transcription-repair coupling factor [Porticoccus litoralis]MDP1521202.1 transcription-repair coupling factor [Porticoccus litoralis]
MSILSLPPLNAPGDRRLWQGVYGAGTALTIAEASQQHQGLTLVITDTAKTAMELEIELRFFLDDNYPVFHFPDWETLPYDLFSPHQDIISERLRTLFRLPQANTGVVVVPVSTLMHRLPPREFVSQRAFDYSTGDHVNLDELRGQLEAAGYHCVDTVVEHGEFAVRGALIDIFPMGANRPFRIDLFDDEIETLRTFDPETQRTLEQSDTICLLPAREVPLDKAAIKRFQDNWLSRFDVDERRCPVFRDVSEGIPSQGVEYFLPLFFEHCVSLFSYLPENCQLFSAGPIEQAAEKFWQDATQRYQEYNVDPCRPLLPPKDVFIPVEELFASLKTYPRTALRDQTTDGKPSLSLGLCALPDVSVDAKADAPLQKFSTFLENTEQRVLICAESAGRRESLLELLHQAKIKPTNVSDWQSFVAGCDTLSITTFPLIRGFSLETPPLAVISETELFGQQVMQRRRRSKQREDADQVIKNLTELRVGAPVVHMDHGVGRYLGLQTIDAAGETQEFLTLQYADDAKLYVPVSSLHMISRYSGSEEELAPLHRLGSEQWQKAKNKALKQIRDTATELLDIYATRAARKGFACRDPEAEYRAFCADFPFEETPDQLETIEAVKKDMLAEQPMDRLVCGDVGFGKTEVAMRAAFIAVASGKQVVMLVPTTLLAHQHLENFRDRFANWPVTIEELSRFRTEKEQQQVLERASVGKVDILIGTHKLLHAKVNYQNLGLLIIDEEHRFGVRQKEKIKALRAEVDILTLTATPIPRTLNLSMSGVRDLSIIATPPARRLSVKSFIRQSDPRVIREAVLREILRGGQVYFLHNEVKSIAKTAQELQELIPEARLEIAHGQMRERELEKVMSDFYHQRFNVLVCTTIIETGIDIPSANTILIDRADKLGLAQLHQLRGRVGRSHHQAYAYLLTPEPKAMTDDAVKRLEAISAADHLGSGFTLATHDLEIRGAGELLGEDQSGHIQSIGFTLYMELLDRAVDAIRKGKSIELDIPLSEDIEINLNIPALIPEDFLPDVHMRLIMYKRIANAQSDEELKELQVEMIDRFGLLPDHLKNLFRVTALKLEARQLGICKVESGPSGGRVEFGSDTVVEPLTIVQMVQKEPKIFSLQGASTLKFAIPTSTTEQRLVQIQALLERLTPKEKGRQ